MNEKVPSWGELPYYAQSELSAADYDGVWFDAQPDPIRLTVLNLYVKLRGMKRGNTTLWSFVDERTTTPLGCLEFLVYGGVEALKQELEDRGEFTRVVGTPASWECREKRSTCALHFKHFKNFPIDKVQAHIDRVGLGFGGRWSPPVIGVAALAAPHIEDYRRNGWQDVYGIRELLKQQGWDRQPLFGIGATAASRGG
jgi:hypothetical protein